MFKKTLSDELSNFVIPLKKQFKMVETTVSLANAFKSKGRDVYKYIKSLEIYLAHWNRITSLGNKIKSEYAYLTY